MRVLRESSQVIVIEFSRREFETLQELLRRLREILRGGVGDADLSRV